MAGLPFLKPKQVAGLIISQRKPDGGKEEQPSEGEHDPALGAASADLIRAVHDKDENAVAAALKAAFEIMESKPHEEAEHTETGKETE